MTSPILVLAIGNESRGDDALAPLLARSLQAEFALSDIEFIEDFQLQVEHVTDLVGRQKILFLDADVSCEAPFHLSAISATQDNSYTSHAMSPFALLHTYRQVYGEDAPSSYLLRLRGYGFELGEGLSDEASANMQAASVIVHEWLAENRT
ncbi:MAG: hydrogenase maturation protease [Sideroxydans sp.]